MSIGDGYDGYEKVTGPDVIVIAMIPSSGDFGINHITKHMKYTTVVTYWKTIANPPSKQRLRSQL